MATKRIGQGSHRDGSRANTPGGTGKLPRVEDVVIVGGFAGAYGEEPGDGSHARSYQTEIEGELFLFKCPDAVNAWTQIGGDVLIESVSGPAGNGLYLVNLSGVRVLRHVVIMPGFQVRISTSAPSDDTFLRNSFVVDMGDPSFRVLGRYKGPVRRADGSIMTDPFHRPTEAAVLAAQAGLL